MLLVEALFIDVLFIDVLFVDVLLALVLLADVLFIIDELLALVLFVVALSSVPSPPPQAESASMALEPMVNRDVMWCVRVAFFIVVTPRNGRK